MGKVTYWLINAALGTALVVAACVQPQPTPTPTFILTTTSLPPTPTPNATPTPLTTPTPRLIPTPTPMATPTATPTPTPSPQPTNTPTAASTPTRTATATPTPTVAPPTRTPVLPSPTPTVIASPNPTSTPSATPTPMPTPAPTSAEDTGSQGCISDPNPEFTAPITDLGKIDFIIPPMVISGNRFKSRSYVWIGRDQSKQVYEVPVYAPVDSMLTGITFYVEPTRNERGEWVDVEQYSLSFEVSCEVSYGYDHILRLAENIAVGAPTIPAESTRDAALQMSPLVKAGDLIGYTTGTAAAHNWDFVFNNSSKRNEFVNQERYENTGDLQGLVAADCPYDYYSEDMRSEYYALLNGGIGGMIEGAGCLISHDQPGTIAGGWFEQPFSRETSHPYIPGWALAVGTWANGDIRINDGETSVWVGPAEPTFVDPKSVTSEHCYEHSGPPDRPSARFVYLLLISDAELALAFGDGSCPEQLPEDYRIYYR